MSMQAGDTLTARLRGKARAAGTLAATYLRSRQSPGGGFCFYRWGGVEEPSLSDTWHAVAAFGLLGVEVPRRDEVVAFLQGFDVSGLDDLYHAVEALLSVGAGSSLDQSRRDSVPVLDAVEVLSNERALVAGRLERALRIVQLQHRFSGLDDPKSIATRVDFLRHDGGWGDKPNLGDTWLALAILDACGVRAFAEATRSFVDSLQIPSFGFTATRDSVYTNLDIVHAGIRAAALLGLPLRHASDAVGFVVACQTEEGGFSRTPDALPNISFTHRGLLALATVGALDGWDAQALFSDTGW